MEPTSKAVIIAKEAGVLGFSVMFNPKELQVDKTVSWTAASTKGQQTEDPKQEFKEPQASTMSVTLYFDTYETGEDVYDKYIKELEKTVKMVDGKGRPPLTTFQWNNFNFEGVVESLSQKYTMFLASGLRVRCEVALKMKSASAVSVASGKT